MKRKPMLGDRVMYRNDGWNAPEIPRLAYVTGFGSGGKLHLTVMREPMLDAGENVCMARPNVMLLSKDEAPHRSVRDWCWYGEYTMGDSGSITGHVPLADDPEADVEDVTEETADAVWGERGDE